METMSLTPETVIVAAHSWV